MPVRIVEWQLPYTWGTGIEIDANKVISLLLREENNLILVNDDNEIYTDLQLASWLTPQSDFPVWVTTGKVLEADGRPQSWLMLNWKTTSWDYARWIYCADGEIYFDGGNWVWRKVYYSSEVDILLQQLRNYVDLNFQPKLTAWAWITIDANNVISAQGTGTWDVSWPNGAVDGHLAVFDGDTGKAIKDWWPVPTQVQVIDNLTSTSTTSALSANQWKVLNDKIDASVNTKTFFLTWTTWATNIATAQDAIDWYLAWKNPLLMYNDRCYTLTWYNDNWEIQWYIFDTSIDTSNIYEIQVWMGQWSQVSYMIERTIANYSWKTRTFMIKSWTSAMAVSQAQSVLNWYLSNNNESDILVNKYNPIILSTDSLGNWQYTYHLTWIDTGVLIFTSLILTDEAPQDYYVERITINYANDTVTSLQRDSYWIWKYRAGSWITIDQNHVISNTWVTSVNGQTWAVALSIPTKTSDLTNDSGYLTSSTWVSSFNWSTWAVTYTAPVSSVNGSTWAVTVSEFAPWWTATTGYVVTKTANGYEWSAPSGWDVVVSSQTGNILQSWMKIWAGTETDFWSLTPDSNTVYLLTAGQSS